MDAMARSSRELRGIDSALQASCRAGECQVPSLRTVLMALVDYKGFRVIAHADIGSIEQMRVVHDLHPERPILDDVASQHMAAVGRELNLKQHAVQINADRRVQVTLSSTAEVHLDQVTGALYMTSLHEILPVDHYVEDAVAPGIDQGVRTMAVSHPGRLNYGDTATYINTKHRLRPEFLAAYRTCLCADAHTPTAGASKRELDTNNAEAARASRFLRETWIPAFVKSLDTIDVRPFDSASLTGEMHRNGINMRYLGMICTLSTIPFIRKLAIIEMIARVTKVLFRDRMRNAILHFRSVGATQIDDQMKSYATSMFNGILGNSEKSARYFDEKIKECVETKFGFVLSAKLFGEVWRPALFLAMQYHFVPRVKTLSGIPQITPTNNQAGHGLKEDDRLAYLLARHFKSVGPRSKLNPSNTSAAALTQVASYYNATGRFEEARLYAHAAMSSAVHNHIVSAFASAQLLFALAGLQANAMSSPDPSLISMYRHAVTVAEWHWGYESPLSLCLHDRMSSIYQRARNSDKALEYARLSLDLAEKSLGINHAHTAAYLTKVGCFLKSINQIDDAIDHLTRALTIYTSLRSDASLIAEVHFHMAECLSERGDADSAIQHAQTCRRLRERIFGFSDIRVIESCRQVSALVLAPYANYKGVLTPQIRQAYREAIACHEKVFRYLKTVLPMQMAAASRSAGVAAGRSGGSVGSMGSLGYMASGGSVGGGLVASRSMGHLGSGGAGAIRRGIIRREAAPATNSNNNNNSSNNLGDSPAAAASPALSTLSALSIQSAGCGASVGSQSTAAGTSASLLAQGCATATSTATVLPASYSGHTRTANLLGSSGAPHPISGPLITSPFGWTQPLGRSLLHKLTKEIVTMKLALLDSPKHRECVRMLRTQRVGPPSPTRSIQYAGGNSGDASSGSWPEPVEDTHVGLDPDEARAVIQRLAAVSPSVYLDGILQRIDDDDTSAVEELRVVLLLTESETVGLTS
eukprot:jgi/Hompol1/5801/HPOL_004714-RA